MRYFMHSIIDSLLLVIVGVVIWLSNLGIIHILWRRDWPLIIVLIGFVQLIKYATRKK